MLNRLKVVLDEMLVTLRLVNQLLRFMIWSFTVRPRGFGVRVQESQMGQVFNYRQNLLPVPDGVASQRLVVTVNGEDQSPIEIPAEALSVTFQAGPAGATVELSLDSIDPSGNDSDNFETEFVIVDGIPPEAPLGFGELVQESEETLPD